MSSTTNQFGWSDRDTAARNMLQFANYAPPTIRRRALQLLEAFRSPSILSELKQIVLDEGRDSWERRYALRAIASIPGDIYLPEFEPLVSIGYGKLNFDDFIALFSKHPSNLQWAFRPIEQLPVNDYLQVLAEATIYFAKGEGLNPILCHKMMELIELHPHLLNLEQIETLYYGDGSVATLQWLHERWDTLIYLCEHGEVDKSFGLLEDWDELREAVFRQCPSCIKEYTLKKQEIVIWRLQYRFALVDYQSSPIWQELNAWYQSALEGDKQAFGKLTRVVKGERENLSKRAVATNFLGKLKDKYDVRPALLHALHFAPDDLQNPYVSLNASIRFEAGEALRDIPSPNVWETMVDAFFIRPHNVLEDFMSDWIAYQTDRLSGIDAPYSGITFGDENRRFWFRALAENHQDQALDRS